MAGGVSHGLLAVARIVMRWELRVVCVEFVVALFVG